ncbi:MAG: hypothetical protein Q3988_04475 [Gemella sp.]|nr:hypothetical protein [Gemella sp.]
MEYSRIILELLRQGAEGEVEDYSKYFFELTGKLGFEEEFAEGWLKENEKLFDLINDELIFYFYAEEDTNNRELCKEFLKPYYEKAKRLVK